MDTRYLLDTNICIYVAHRKAEPTLSRFNKLTPGEAAISVITYGELLYGASKSVRRQESLATLHEFVQLVQPLPLPETAAELYGFLRADLEDRGEPIGGNDLWISAHALASGLILVTNNEKEFRRVRGLKVQNWAA